MRSGDHNGNPLGSTMGRNYRFFNNLSVKKRVKLSKELQQWKALSEAAQNIGAIPIDQAGSA